jgi:hypothetical protein
MSDVSRPEATMVRRGRPRAADGRTSGVTAWLAPKYHDNLIRVAQQQGVSVSRLAGLLIIRGLAAK